MRLKFNREDPNTYKCCFCCHVRTGTILYGLFRLLMHILAVGLFIVVQLRPDLIHELQQDVDPNSTEYSPFEHNFFANRKWTSEDKMVLLLITLGSFGITSMLVYGSARGRPGYLMPFFCLQVFNFCVLSLTIVGYFSNMPDIKKVLADQKYFPLKDYLLKLDPDWLMLLLMFFFILVMTFKAYFIGMVWSCYKYLQTRGVATVRTTDYSSSEDSEMLLPPKYEDAVRQAANEPPPPEYQP